MRTWCDEIKECTSLFLKMAKLGDCTITSSEFEYEFLGAPHKRPTRIPKGKVAIYAFWFDGKWLKIGKVGIKSKARYTSHQYNPNAAKSTLARNLLNNPKIKSIPGFDTLKPGPWIEGHIVRVNILLPEARDGFFLSLFESFLHFQLNPRYEGRNPRD